jgi:hypothetical protein
MQANGSIPTNRTFGEMGMGAGIGGYGGGVARMPGGSDYGAWGMGGYNVGANNFDYSGAA